jgi:chromosome partitioning protein
MRRRSGILKGISPNLYDAAAGDAQISSIITKTQVDGLTAPADRNLVGANLNWWMFQTGSTGYRTIGGSSRHTYPYVQIDCPPALDLLTLNALIAADSVLIPIQCEFFALEGISQLIDTIDRVNDSFGHPLRIEGILLTMYDDRTNLARQVADDLKEFFEKEVFRTVIARSIRLAEAPSHGKSILQYDVRSKAAESYIKLAKEILENDQAARTNTQGIG